MKHGLSRALAALLALALALAGCGGGVGLEGTGGLSYTQGTITGFGSVIVNGIRFDDASASVQDGEGTGRTRDDLQLGMVVEIQSGAIDTTTTPPSAKASSVRYASEIVAAVAAVDATAGQFTLLGQTVVVDAATVFAEALAGGLAALQPGQRVEVYGAWDAAASRYRATRVDAAAASGNFRLRGVASQVDTTQKTLRIGSGQFSYTGQAPTGLADGNFVRVQVQAAPPTTAVWSVVSLASAAPSVPDGAQTTLTGLVNAYTSSTSFSVNGVAVDAARATFPDGTTGVVLGARVQVKGQQSGGKLVADQVRVLGGASQGGGGGGGGGNGGGNGGGGSGTFELSGPVTQLNAAASTFRVRNTTVHYGSGTTFQGGTAADLAKNGTKVTVQGALSTDGTRVEAALVRFD